MVNEIVLNKIKKLLALSSSPNESEAAVAIEKAHHLLKEYNLSMSDITQDNRFSILEESYYSYKRERQWKTYLCVEVAGANFCSALKVTSRNGTVIKIVGKEHNIIGTKVMLDYLVATVERLSKTIPVKSRESYKMGIVESLGVKLQNMHKQDLNQSNALVVVEQATIQQYFKEKATKVSTEVAKYKVTNSVAYYKGKKDGYDISLNQQMGTSSTPRACIHGY